MVTEKWIKELIKNNELWKFYKTKEWIRLKKSILREHHYECAECRKNGIITRYDINKDGERKLISTVHHVCHVRQRTDLALSRTYKDYVTGEELPNLIPVCKACHNKLHPEKIFRETQSDHFMNTERW